MVASALLFGLSLGRCIFYLGASKCTTWLSYETGLGCQTLDDDSFSFDSTWNAASE